MYHAGIVSPLDSISFQWGKNGKKRAGMAKKDDLIRTIAVLVGADRTCWLSLMKVAFDWQISAVFDGHNARRLREHHSTVHVVFIGSLLGH